MQINGTPPTAMDSLTASTTTRTSTAMQAPTDASSAVQGKTSAQVSIMAASYSANAGGKSYSVSVEEAGGVYVASVEVPPEASASGSSVQAAEDSLNARIDALV